MIEFLLVASLILNGVLFGAYLYIASINTRLMKAGIRHLRRRRSSYTGRFL